MRNTRFAGLNDVGPHNDLQYTGATDDPTDFSTVGSTSLPYNPLTPLPQTAVAAPVSTGISTQTVLIGVALLLVLLVLLHKKGN